MKNKSVLSAICLCMGVLLCFPVSCVAQQLDLEKFVGRKCAAFVVVEEPHSFLQSLEDLLVDSNPYVGRALEILCDAEHSPLEKNTIDHLYNRWTQFKDRLSKLREISMVVYPNAQSGSVLAADGFDVAANEFPKFSIVLNGSSDNTKGIYNILSGGQSTAQKRLQSLLPERLKKKEKDPDSLDKKNYIRDQRRATETEMNRFAGYWSGIIESLSVKRAGNIVIISNDEANATELLNRLSNSADSAFRSLSRHRSYLLVQNLLDRRSQAPVIRGYFVPENFPEYAAQLVAKSLEFQPKTLRAGGFNVSLQTDAPEVQTSGSQYSPVVECDLVMTFTEPAMEFGKIVESFVPLETPPLLSLNFEQLSVVGFDSNARDEAFQETIEMHGESMVPKVNEEEPIAASENDAQVEGLFDEGDYDVFNDSEEDYNPFNDYEVFGLGGESKKFSPSSVADFSNMRLDAWVSEKGFKVNRWLEMYPVKNADTMSEFFSARMKAEKDLLDPKDRYVELDNEFGKLLGRDPATVRAEAMRVKENEGGDAMPNESDADGEINAEFMQYEAEFFLNDQWMICTDHITMKRVLADLYTAPPASSKFNDIFSAARKRNGDQVPVKINYHSEEHAEKPPVSMQLSYLKRKYFNLHQQELLAEVVKAGPDEFGLLGALESKDDVLVAVQQLVQQGWKDVFGTWISLAYVQDNNFHIFGQCYSKDRP